MKISFSRKEVMSVINALDTIVLSAIIVTRSTELENAHTALVAVSDWDLLTQFIPTPRSAAWNVGYNENEISFSLHDDFIEDFVYMVPKLAMGKILGHAMIYIATAEKIANDEDVAKEFDSDFKQFAKKYSRK